MEIKSSDGIQVDWFFPMKSFDKEKEGQGLVKESTSWWWKEGEIGEESLAHLFVDGVPLAEDEVLAEESRNERVCAALLPAARLLLHG